MAKIEFVVENETDYRREVVGMLLHHIAYHDQHGEINDGTAELYRQLLKERHRLLKGAIVGE